MHRTLAQDRCVLAIDPANRSFGFVVMEGHDCLINWGLKAPQPYTAAKDLLGVKDLIERYQPDVIVVEDAEDKKSRRCRRVRQLIRKVHSLGLGEKIPVKSFSREEVKKEFGKDGATTKHQIATAIAESFPELAPRLPPPRALWQQENCQMAVFNAMSFALVYFKNRMKKAA